MAENTKKQEREPREMRLVTEYIAKVYPKFQTITRARLGGTHPSLLSMDLSAAEKRMLTVWRRWCDALIFTPRKVILLEAAILPSAGDISILKHYGYLFGHTPEYKDFWSYELQLELLYAIEDPVVTKLAKMDDIKCSQYYPDWLTEYVKGLYGRKQRAPLTYPI